MKNTLGETEASLEVAKTQADDLTQDQTRIRADIDSLNRVKGQEDQVRSIQHNWPTTKWNSHGFAITGTS